MRQLITIALLLAAACGGGEPGGLPAAALRADTDHDGALTSADDAAGAEVIFLANLDDDDGDGARDAQDVVVNGEADVADLAPVEVLAWADAPEDAGATLALAAPDGAVRLFRRKERWEPVIPPLQLTRDELRAGALFAIEGTVPVGTPSTPGWDGTARLDLAIEGGEERITSTVALRVAPVLFQHNAADPELVYYTGGVPYNADFADAIRAALPGGPRVKGLVVPGDRLRDWDPWTQDFLDVAHMARPGPGGAPVSMRLAVRSAQPDRPAGLVVQDLLGPDTGWIEVGSGREPASDLAWSMNSFGNWEVIPPHAGFPLGRNLWGATEARSARPDDVFADFVRAQRVQGELQVDTSWLVVGHVDEIVSFARAEDGHFRLFAASPELAREMLLDLQAQGHGGAVVFEGKLEVDLDTGATYPADVTVDDLLADPDVMAASQEAQARIDEVVAALTAAIGVDGSEVVPFPFLFTAWAGRLTAHQPGTVNLLPAGRTLIIPDPFGPRVGGEDVFVRDLRDRLSPLGYTPAFVDDWDVYHVNLGEVHCGTNAVRRMDVRFWEVSP